MTSIPQNDVWVEFFERFRELPELWKVKPDNYIERNKKRNAWPKLLEVYRKIDPNSNVESLKRRINNIRSCYRREMKKVELSQKIGAVTGMVYTSSLWYYENLNFLYDQEAQIRGKSDIEKAEFEVDQTEEIKENETADPSYSCSEKKRKTLGQHMTDRNVLLKQAWDQLANTYKDEASVFAESWATSYRKLPPAQQIYAKKAIEEILVLGQLNLLSLHSVCSPTDNYSATSSASSTPNPPQCSSLPPGSNTSFLEHSISSPPIENIVIPVEIETSVNSNVQQLSDNSFS